MVSDEFDVFRKFSNLSSTPALIGSFTRISWVLKTETRHLCFCKNWKSTKLVSYHMPSLELFCKNWKSTKLVSYHMASLELFCKTGNQQNWYLTTWHLWSCSAKTGNQQNWYLTTWHLWGCCSAKTGNQQNWYLTTWHLWGCCSAKLEINKTGVTFVKGTPGVSVLLEQQIVKNCFDACHALLQFQKFHKRE